MGRKDRETPPMIEGAAIDKTGADPRSRGAHTKWGPTSLPTPTIRSCPVRLAPRHPGPLLFRSAARKTMRCDARRNNPAMVWSAPFRGPASPEKPFIISSRASAETAALQKRWTAFQLPDRVRINSWESLRSVIELSVDFLVNQSVLFWLVLQPPLMSRRSDVSVVR